MIARHYGRSYSLGKLRELSFISKDGASLMGISDAAEKIGFRTQGVSVTARYLRESMPLPCILHWDQRHFVVCYSIRRRRRRTFYYIDDPARGKNVYSWDELRSHWAMTPRGDGDRGIALSLQPSLGFYQCDVEELHGSPHGMEFLFRYVRPYYRQLLHVTLGTLLLLLIGFVFPILTQSLVDVGIGTGNRQFVMLVVLSQFILSLSQLGISFAMSWVSLHVNTRINVALIYDFWKKLMRLPIKSIETRNTGDILQRLGDHGRIESFLVQDTMDILLSALCFVAYGTLLLVYDPTILGIFLVGQAVYVAWILLFLGRWRKLDYKFFDVRARENDCTLQLIQGMREIKLNNEETHKAWEWEDVQARMLRCNIAALRMRQVQDLGSSLLTKGLGLSISLLVAEGVIRGSMTMGMMMSVSYIVGQLETPIGKLVDFLHSLQNARISLERLNEIHSQADEEQGSPAYGGCPPVGDLCLEHVSFSYTGSSRDMVLRDVSCRIPHGKVTAIVGMSGSGKTTIMKLLLGLYSPQEGRVLVDGVRLSLIPPRSWRSVIGAVMQDGFVFSDTLARNVTIGFSTIDWLRLNRALEVANLSSFVSDLPFGVDSRIGANGIGISQGQRQRVLIARAVYKNPDYLFFDEATNSLDTRNEREIMSKLSEFYAGKTVVVCAHRLSTIRNADQILVVKDGRIVEVGTHGELLGAHGEYCQLLSNQMQMLDE